MVASLFLSTRSAPEKYRPDIDGLRAIAVSSVIAFHAFPGLLPGGFVGVDIFFVISGFLIGGLIATGARSGTFSFADFYARRARRIFPALALVLAATLAAGWWVLLPDEFASLGRHVIAGAGFVANLLLWRESSYFDIDAARKPLLHLWSLGVEEQFYLVWPPLAILAFRLGLPLTALATVMALASFIWSGFEAHRDLIADFFSPATRFWELMVGVLVAEVIASLAPSPRRDHCLGALGLALIAVSFWAVRADVRFPGFWVLLPVAGAAMILAAGLAAHTNRFVLSRRPMVYIGLISYPLYLWHWPPLAFANTLLADGPAIRALCVVFAIVAAAGTWSFVERPIRYGGKGRMATIAASGRALISAGALAVVGGCGAASVFISPRIGMPELGAGLAEAHKKFDRGLIWRSVPTPPDGKPLSLVVIGDFNRPKTLFIGDSHAIQYGPRVQRLIDDRLTDRAALFSIGWGCAPIPKLQEPIAHDFCEGYVERSIALAKADPSVLTIVFAADWLGGISPRSAALTKFYFEKPDGTKTYVGRDAPALRRAAEELASAIRDLRAAGKAVFVVLNVPTGGEVNPHSWIPAIAETLSRAGLIQARDFDATAYLAAYRNFRALFAPLATEAVATVVEPILTLCHSTERCDIGSALDPAYFDDSHLSVAYARDHAAWIDATMK